MKREFQRRHLRALVQFLDLLLGELPAPPLPANLWNALTNRLPASFQVTRYKRWGWAAPSEEPWDCKFGLRIGPLFRCLTL